MQKVRNALMITFTLALALLLISCTSDNNLAKESAEDVIEQAGMNGYYVEGEAKEITTKDSESHQMIIKMRLLQYDMSPNLEDYRSTYLVEMKNSGGETITVVVVNEDGNMKSLLPENQQD